MTLGWPQFVTLGSGLCTVAIVMSILSMRDIDEVVYRYMVVPYEQAFGFEVGLVTSPPGAPDLRRWGIARVTPGGIMDRAGLRSGDYIVGTHTSFPEFYSALDAVAEGRSTCVAVINIEDAAAGTYRSRLACMEGKAQD